MLDHKVLGYDPARESKLVPGPERRLRAILADMELDWQLDAKCRGVPLGKFYPGRGNADEVIKEIIQEFCDHCDVRQPCLDYALLINAEDGVWGGTSGNERRRMRSIAFQERQQERKQAS